MIKIEELKSRLEKLPQLKDERKLASYFLNYTDKLKILYTELLHAYRDMQYATKVNSNADYAKKVLPKLKDAVSLADKLYKKITEDAANISKGPSDIKIVKIGDCAKTARHQCNIIWDCEIKEVVGKWKDIASVVQTLGAEGGREFKNMVDNISRHSIPQSDAEVESIKEVKNHLQNSVANLGLEGPFGKFLEKSAGVGASPRDLLNKEVKVKLEKYKLWDSFRVRLV